MGSGRGRLSWLGCCAVGLAFGLGGCVWAQSGTDGAIGGQVLSAAGSPVEGALVVARDLQTGLAMQARSGSKGEFLLVRLPVAEYELSVEEVGVELTLPEPVQVGLGEVTEVGRGCGRLSLDSRIRRVGRTKWAAAERICPRRIWPACP